jgi:ribonuclease G
MERDLIIHKNAKGVQIALLEDRRLVELHVDDNKETFSTGNIYLGKVKKINPGLRAAFVNVGHPKEAFIHYTDLNPNIRSILKFTRSAINGSQDPLMRNFKREKQIDKDGKIEEVLKKGSIMLTQVLKEPISTKGPRLSCEIALPGRFIVLAPFGNTVGISKKIGDRDERKRLQRVLESVRPKNFGVVARTNAIGKNTAEIHADITNLLNKWRRITEAMKKAQSPKLLMAEIDKSLTIVRDMMNDSFSTICTDDRELYDDIREFVERFAPEKKNIIKHYRSRKPLFEAYNINRQIKSAFGKTVTMRSGAYLVIEHTEAMHVIDVNSGPKINRTQNQDDNAFRVNKEAAEEIARQLRLRNIGGIIVIDFIDMRSNKYRTELWRHMQQVMRGDKAKHSILPISKFGLMEITRQRSSAELNIDTTERLPKGSGNVESCLLLVDEIKRELDKAQSDGGKAKYIYVHPFVEAYMKRGFRSIRNKWSMQYKTLFTVIGDSSYSLVDYAIHDKEGVQLA